jgi:hypothetical protein
MQRGKPEDLIQDRNGGLDGMCVVCAGLIRLCRNLDFFSPDMEIRRLLIDQLHGIADDHDHAKTMIYQWLKSSPAAPKVSDFLRMAQETRKQDALPAGCGQCRGEPFVVQEDGARRCTCPRGQALRQMDQRLDANGGRIPRSAVRSPAAPDWKAAACPD